MEAAQITLGQILTARENRVKAQQAFLTQYRCPIISFTMNIAGPVKDTPLIRRAFREGLAQLKRLLPADTIHAFTQTIEPTGCHALYAVSLPADTIKEICVGIEERTPLGRLFDMDVLDAHGIKLQRSRIRGCIVCGTPGRNCAARRLHSVDALQSVTRHIIESYFLEADADTVADNAVQSLMEEVNVTPKPGLVDRRNNGSHTDMDLPLFTASANALRPYFRECFVLGRKTPLKDLFYALRQAGLQAEAVMYRVTGGINTHKGAIFSMGLLCGSMGSLWSAADPHPQAEAVLAQCAQLAASAVRQDFIAAAGITNGERLYLRHGISGARGEAAAGYPSVWQALSFFRHLQGKTPDRNHALTATLLYLIAHITDTNLYHRGGAAGAKWAASAAKALLPLPALAQVEALDDAFIERNLSPGGCADLLAAVIFLDTCCHHS